MSGPSWSGRGNMSVLTGEGGGATPAGQAAGNLRGAAIMTFSMTVYTCNDATMKFVMAELPFYQSITIRSGLACAILLLVMTLGRTGGYRRALVRIGRRDALLIGLRMLAEAGSTVLFLTALTRMALGDVSAIAQTTPLFVVLAAALFLGERVGWRRLLAVGIGVLGMLLIIRPGTPRFDVAALMVLGAVLLIVLRDIVTRMMSGALPPVLTALSAALSVTVCAAVLSILQGWQMPDMQQAGLLAMAGVLVSLGYLSAIMTVRAGDVSFSAPFRYVSLVVAVILGYVVFGEFPDLWTWIGAGLIVGAGLFVAWREVRLARGQRGLH